MASEERTLPACPRCDTISRAWSEAVSQRDELESEVARLRDVVAREAHEIEQILGKALHYPVYGPEVGGTGLPCEDVCVGEHVPASLAMEAAGRIEWGDAKAALLHELAAAAKCYRWNPSSDPAELQGIEDRLDEVLQRADAGAGEAR